MKSTTKNCLNCDSEFKAEVRYLTRGHAKFCSRTCSATHNGNKQKRKPNVKCAYCDKLFHKSKSSQEGSKSGLFFCCRKHKDAAQRIGGIEEIMPSHYGTSDKPSFNYRKLAFANHPHKCNRCLYDRFPQALVVHHIDHNRENNELNNLEILCPTCHWEHHLGLT